MKKKKYPSIHTYILFFSFTLRRLRRSWPIPFLFPSTCYSFVLKFMKCVQLDKFLVLGVCVCAVVVYLVVVVGKNKMPSSCALLLHFTAGQ